MVQAVPAIQFYRGRVAPLTSLRYIQPIKDMYRILYMSFTSEGGRGRGRGRAQVRLKALL